MPSTYLQAPTASEKLEEFINHYNQDIDAFEQLESKLDGIETLLSLKTKSEETLKDKLQESIEKVEVLEAKLDQSYVESDQVVEENKLIKARLETAANNNLSLNESIKALETALKDKDKEISELNSGMNPVRLKKQLAESKKKRLETLTAIKAVRKTRNDAYAEANKISLQLKESHQTIVELQLHILEQKKRLDHSTGAFIFKDGPHYLLRWEENSVFETIENTSYTVKTAIYFHESGRMALISIDPISGKPAICRAPVGGIRPNAALIHAAKKYLTNSDSDTNEAENKPV